MDYLTTKIDGFRGATPYDLVDKILWFEMMGILAGAGPRNWTIPQVSCSLSFLMFLVWPTKSHTAGHQKNPLVIKHCNETS